VLLSFVAILFGAPPSHVAGRDCRQLPALVGQFVHILRSIL
jgi:hypothetical protein